MMAHDASWSVEALGRSSMLSAANWGSGHVLRRPGHASVHGPTAIGT